MAGIKLRTVRRRRGAGGKQQQGRNQTIHDYFAVVILAASLPDPVNTRHDPNQRAARRQLSADNRPSLRRTTRSMRAASSRLCVAISADRPVPRTSSTSASNT